MKAIELIFLEKDYDIKGKNETLYHLKIVNEYDHYIFESKVNDILYKKTLLLKDFDIYNSFYNSITN